MTPDGRKYRRPRPRRGRTRTAHRHTLRLRRTCGMTARESDPSVQVRSPAQQTNCPRWVGVLLLPEGYGQAVILISCRISPAVLADTSVPVANRACTCLSTV